MPSMKFTLNHTNIIAPPKLLVGEDEYRPLEKNERFIDYNKEAYIYKYNPLNGEILFGDNIHGHMPLPQQKIHTKRYTLSNGEDGNVGQGQLTLNTSIPSIESATNIVPATGGANAETLEDLIQRAPEVLRIKNRVVTAKDYEDAAVDFSPYIVNAKAISRENNIVDVIVVTKDTLEQSSTKEALQLQKLEKRLAEMSLVTVKPNVKPAETIKINIKVELVSTREDKKY
jgi:predicted phage baseplate assembly protein